MLRPWLLGIALTLLGGWLLVSVMSLGSAEGRALVGAVLILTGLLSFWSLLDAFARRILAATKGSAVACDFCGRKVKWHHCKQCNIIVTKKQRTLIAILMIQHRSAIIGTIATLAGGALCMLVDIVAVSIDLRVNGYR